MRPFLLFPDTLAAELYARHQKALRAYLRTVTGSTELADEISQDVYLRVVQFGTRYEARGKERAWLFRIARNLVADHYRRRPATQVADVDVGRPGTQAQAVSLQQGIARLPDRERETFLLCELGGLSYAEIADATLMTVSAVRSAIYRARIQLRGEVMAPSREGVSVAGGDRDDD